MDNFKGIAKKSASISALVLVGKVLGFVKQAVIAWAFGSNSVTDIYFAAGGYATIFGQIMTQSVGPTILTQYVKLSSEGKEAQSKKLIRDSYLFFTLLSIVIVAVNVLFSEQICKVIGISYSAEQRSELRFFLIAFCPTVLFTSLIGISSGYLDSHNRFLPGRLTGLFFSVSIIVTTVLFKNSLGLRALLYGFLIGYILHTMLMLGLVMPKVGIRASNPFKNAELISMIKRFIPLVIGVSAVDFGHLIDKIIASSLEPGSVSALYYGQVISSDLVNAVIITSVGSVLLTSFTKSASGNRDKSELLNSLQQTIFTITLLSSLITVLYVVEGSDLVKLFFERGSFDSSNTRIVSSIASFYALGFVFMANREVLIKAHYAFQDTFMPMVNSIIGVIINLLGSILLSRFMGASGIALATSASMIAVAFLSLLSIKKHLGRFPINKSGFLDLIKIIIATGVTVFIGLLIRQTTSHWMTMIRMVFVSAIIVIVYALSAFLLKESVFRATVIPVVRNMLKNTRDR